jgi:hypothetical protein
LSSGLTVGPENLEGKVEPIHSPSDIGNGDRVFAVDVAEFAKSFFCFVKPSASKFHFETSQVTPGFNSRMFD